MQDQPALDSQPAAIADATKTVYAEGFDDMSANVVIKGSHGVSFRVHDYYLKASSHFFRDLLEAGTKGGPIPLDATSHRLKFLLDKVVGRTPKKETLRLIAEQAPNAAIDGNYHMLWSLIELDRIAQKYLFDDVSTCVQGVIGDYAHKHAPLALSFACKQTPPHGIIAFNALRAFEDTMPLWMDHYFDADNSVRARVYLDTGFTHAEKLSPAIQNLTKSFAKELGWEAMLAYARAMNKASIESHDSETDEDDVDVYDDSGRKRRAKDASWSWDQVAKEFIKDMDIEGQGALMEGSESEPDFDDDLFY